MLFIDARRLARKIALFLLGGFHKLGVAGRSSVGWLRGKIASGHEVGDPGFADFEARYPDQHVVIIVLSNEDDSPVRDIADAMAKRLFGD